MTCDTKKLCGVNSCPILVTRVATYTSSNITAVPFVILSDKFRVTKGSQIKSDRLSPLGSSVPTGYNMTVNLSGLPSNPTLSYAYISGECQRQKIIVNQLFLLDTSSNTPVGNIIFAANIVLDNVVLSGQSVQPLLWQNILAGSAYYANGNFTPPDPTGMTITLTGTVDNPTISSTLDTLLVTPVPAALDTLTLITNTINSERAGITFAPGSYSLRFRLRNNGTDSVNLGKVAVNVVITQN